MFASFKKDARLACDSMMDVRPPMRKLDEILMNTEVVCSFSKCSNATVANDRVDVGRASVTSFGVSP